MKLNLFTPAEWDHIINPNGRDRFCHCMARGFLQCGNCSKRLDLTPSLFDQYLKTEFPICCEGTLKGGTMNYYRDEAQLKKELQLG